MQRILPTAMILAVLVALAALRPVPARADVTIPPIDDSFVRVSVPTTNFDEYVDELSVTATGFPTGAPEDIGYLRFALHNLTGTLTGVTLRLYNQASPGSLVTVAVYSTTGDDWNGAGSGDGDETTITFNLAPAENAQLNQQVGASSPAWMEWSSAALTSYVAAELAGDDIVTFRIKVTSTGIADVCIFEDRENGGGTGNRPQLVLAGLGPTAVTVTRLSARGTAAGVDVRWSTAAELKHAGFNVYRATQGTDRTQAVRVNERLIPTNAQAPMAGADYAFLDRSAAQRGAYWYWLEAVDATGGSDWFGPVRAEWPQGPLFLPFLARGWVPR